MYKHVYPYWLKQLAQQGIHMKILAGKTTKQQVLLCTAVQ